MNLLRSSQDKHKLIIKFLKKLIDDFESALNALYLEFIKIKAPKIQIYLQ